MWIFIRWADANALRIEFLPDDEIDSIRSFDVMTQRSISPRTEARIYPARRIFAQPGGSARRRRRGCATSWSAASSAAIMPCASAGWKANSGSCPLKNSSKAAEAESPREAREAAAPVPRRDRGFAQIIDALETGRSFDGADGILPVLMDYNATLLDYFDDPILVLDQPERVRERAENRFLEFKEMFTAAMEHGDALGIQAQLLLTYDELLAHMDGRSMIIANPFLRSDSDFRPQAVVQIEGRNAAGYQANIQELKLDIDKWRDDGWQIALLAGGRARSERLLGALESLECPADFPEEWPEAHRTGSAGDTAAGIESRLHLS